MKSLYYLLIFGVIFCYVYGDAIDVMFPKSVDYRCTLPMDDKPMEGEGCQAHIRVFGYHSGRNQCRHYFYGGCGGNGNRFFNKDECKRHCIKKKKWYPTINKNKKNYLL
ncbi:hypothetical protein PYW07_011783 [Mythimna separata]|uniref:BPTI/Kunitz inhibitor domain-containing protein n=1 Tax=Mythimna separata TaxID=271217 RepID=A0AAD7Y6W0_MYTSE|nr:hypothetical protein PYW07_011783 [Mythimna separata]